MTEACAHRRVLIVEDNADIRESLSDALGGEGYSVVTATNGQEGLDRLREMEAPCLILVDLLMPVMNGSEFLAALRATDVLATIPVVVVSAVSAAKDAADLDAEAFFPKPFEIDRLLATVGRLC